MLFVGYGVSAPERGWDDFKGVDLKGKVAVFLINDPDFEAVKGEDPFGKFGGKTMTYYGRWTYKFEEAARRGAIGALIVHDTPGAGYGWNVVVSPSGENYDLVRPADKLTSLQVQGWVEGDAAKALFAGAGQDLATLRKQARSAKFKPVELKGATFSAAFPVRQEVVQSANVLARIPGAKRPDETVMYGAHWDAYGEGTPDAQGRIYRAGANDDALGMAGLFEIARAFKAAPAPDRSIVFAAWTAEERGLLGSEHYAQNPVYPLDKTVANLTIDVLQTAGKAKDVILIGKGQDTLEDDLAKFAAKQGRVITQESLPERGLFYRADHFSMAKRGVPAISFNPGRELVNGGAERGKQLQDAYTKDRYHQPADEYDANWDTSSWAGDLTLLYNVGRRVADSHVWPNWSSDSEFRAARDATATQRK